MKIKASQIVEWSKTKEAQSELPRLIRRLVNRCSTITAISFPSGDSVSQSGWDGEVSTDVGNAWVPKGKSVWELSCQQTATVKANSDYTKRTKATPKSIRQKTAYVAVSAAKWTQSKTWVKDRSQLKEWKSIIAYGPDDLEQWLEENSSISLQFSEELGLSGYGIQSPQAFWKSWSSQTEPAITKPSFLLDRDEIKAQTLKKIRDTLKTGSGAFGFKADSTSEGVAFISAVLSDASDLQNTSVIITNSSGWSFVEKNPSIIIAIPATPELAEHPCSRADIVKIVPFAAGDMEQHFSQVSRLADPELKILRQNIYKYKEALIGLGIDKGDAERLASVTGRSWSVFRRQMATNPAIKRPEWLDHPSSGSLSSVCLLGSWLSVNQDDQAIVAELSNQDYDTLEKDLLEISYLNDSPILKIGNTWRAKSPLELMTLFGPRISKAEIDRFLNIAKRLLIAPDPKLELPPEERYAAQIHGKVRPTSGFLFKSILKSLVKLSVRSPAIAQLNSLNVEFRIRNLVESILKDADSIRWLSLSSSLRSLAEAAPEEFLRSIENSLNSDEQSVCQLIRETGDSSIMGNGCWHADLLWALELLAWSPEKLLRVCRVLCKLEKVEVKGNWSNTPFNTLLSFFRSWHPETAASVSQRNTILSKVVEEDQEVGFRLIDSILNRGSDFCSPNMRPKWRDDDAGANNGVTNKDVNDVCLHAAELMISQSSGNPARVSELVDKLDMFHSTLRDKTYSLMNEIIVSETISEHEKKPLRDKLRKRIHWHRNYSDLPKLELEKYLAPLEDAYARLEPKSTQEKIRWLFENGWPDPPVNTEKRMGKRDVVEELRRDAVQELYSKCSWSEFVEYFRSVSESFSIGNCLSKNTESLADFLNWTFDDQSHFTESGCDRAFFGGYVWGMKAESRLSFIISILENKLAQHWNVKKVVSVLTIGQANKQVWDYVDTLSEEIEIAYWEACQISYHDWDTKPEFDFVVNKLLENKRPHSAVNVCSLNLTNTETHFLIGIIEGILRNEEANTPRVDHYHIAEILDTLEERENIDSAKLMQYQFALFNVYGYSNEMRAKTLMMKVMTDPNVFLELMKMAFKGKSIDELPADKILAANAEKAYRILHGCSHPPGAAIDGLPNEGSFIEFIDKARELCKVNERLGVCDSVIGEILARCGDGEDGVWPIEPARTVLDRIDSKEMRNGFYIGALNKRGVTSRIPGAGGQQERELAERYRGHSRKLIISHPLVAQTIEEIASNYDRHGHREDVEANLRREDY